MDNQDQALLELAQALRGQDYQFVTPSPLTHARVNQRPENQLARDLAGVFGWSRPFYPDLLPADLYTLMRQAEAIEPCGELFRARYRLSSLAGELLWHSAYPTHQVDAVFFGPDTYRFAQAIETCLRTGRPMRRVADVGCGSGAGAILAARALPDAEVLALDINPEALRLTRINARLAGVSNLQARHSDLLQDVPGEFDLLLANPPYLVDPDQRAYRHGGGPLGAGLSLAIVEAAQQRLSPGGSLLLYTGVAMRDNGDPFREAVRRLCENQPVRWSYREVDPDVFGEELLAGAYVDCDRIAAVVLTLGRSPD
ncbi:methyltransferase [Stutzerimonas tarimensis]|uniref:Methyltransferase n=1 Tax=Stutzerimonas tarimensis TaxID=1507735 RepID=A0ABV7T5U8_9GAMM